MTPKMNQGYIWSSLEKVASHSYPWLLARVILVLLLLSAIALILLPWQQVAVGYGKVVALSPQERIQEISAPVDGRVTEWMVGEGSQVKEGDPIAEVVDNDPDILEKLRAERNAIARRVDAARAQVQTAGLNMDRQKSLFDKGLSARKQYEESVITYKRLVAEEANAMAELTRVDVRLSRQQMQQVTAPVDGTIVRVLSSQGGQVVKQGQMLATIVPKTSSRAVEVWIHGNDLPLVYEGREARLEFEGWPAIQFSGWPSIAVGTFPGVVTLVDATDDGSGRFRILVQPKDPKVQETWPDARFLRQGVRVRAWVLLNQVRLGFELWRRFNGFPPTLDEAPKPYAS